MKEPTSFYTAQILKHKEVLAKVIKELVWSSIFRLSIVLLIITSVYFFFGNMPLVAASFITGSILFLFLVTRHTSLQYRRDFHLQLIALNEVELQVQKRDFHHLPDGTEFIDPTHFYSQDIDLFGRGSFFQYLNRTALPIGKKLLATFLKENKTDQIEQKQKAIKELAALPEWRQEFSAGAALVKTEISSLVILKWLNGYRSFVPQIFKILPVVFTIISIAGWALYFFNAISGYIVFGWFLVGIAITGKYLKNINKLASYCSQVQGTFQQYYKLISHIETQEFSTDLLSQKRSEIINPRIKASETLEQFSRLLNSFDQRNNMLIGVITNGFMLRDLNFSYKIGQWISAHAEDVEQWFDAIHFFDAFNSLGNFSFNHTSYTFPQLVNDSLLLDARQAAHPLLNPTTAVKNDIHISEEEFFIITGANMAGKSTFLRTVALQIVMSNMGLPVFAKSAKYKPIKLITSMRTTDSLTDEASYFFSELTRLKYIVDSIEEDRYFIILDEILKGTNSTDKANGSKKFIEKLVRSKSTGIIATHDLSLCTTADELEEVKNHYFDAQIIADELYFDYSFKAGICQNMNASFLLKKMGIVD
jgi:hypothetical protein